MAKISEFARQCDNHLRERNMRDDDFWVLLAIIERNKLEMTKALRLLGLKISHIYQPNPNSNNAGIAVRVTIERIS